MYKRSARDWAKYLDFILIDIICLELSLLIAFIIRHGFVNPFSDYMYTNLYIIIGLMDFFLILLFNIYMDVIERGYYKELVSIIKHSIAIFLSVSAYFFVIKEGGYYSRYTLIMTGVFNIVLSYPAIVLWKKHVINKRAFEKGSNLLIMAGKESAAFLIKEIRNNNIGQHHIIGVVVNDESNTESSIENVEIVASYSTVVEYVKNNWVDEILVSMRPGDNISEEILDTLIAMGVTVHMNIEIQSSQLAVKQVFGNVGGLAVITNSMNYMTHRQYVMKRTMDIIGGLIGCIITGILFLILAPIIKIKSPGPVFFVQTRIGRNGKPFKIYKFRSMYMDAEERKAELLNNNRIKDGLMFKMDFDPRVIGNVIDEKGNKKTGIGEFIRKYSIDEFPQFFNVLNGSMTLVGTRPPLVEEYNAYSARHKARLAIKPGITGLWQISGRSNIVDFEEVLKYDTEYINNWSIGLDIKILLKTIIVVLKKEGSM